MRLRQRTNPMGGMEDPRKGASLWRAGLAFMTCWLVLAWPWLSASVTIPYDAKAQFLPSIQFLAHSLWSGESPFWTPFIFSGYPQIADPQSLIFSPPFLLLALLDPSPGLWSSDVTVFLVIAAGGLGLLVWARDQGWAAGAAILACVSFGFGAAMSWRVQHVGQVLSVAMLAITLMLLSRALTRASWKYGLAAGITGAFMMLGRDQVALLGAYLLCGFVVWHWATGTGSPRQRLLSSLPPLIAGGIAGLAIVAVPIVLTWLLAEASNRPNIDYIGAGKGSLHPALLVTLFAPDLFGASGPMENYWGPPSFTWTGTNLFIAQNMGVLYLGAVPAWLLLSGLFNGDLWRREIRFYSVAAFVMLLYALGWYTPAFRLAHDWLPGINLFRRPADAVFLLGFLLSILTGYCAHRLLSGNASQRKAPWLLSSLAVIAAFAYAGFLATQFDRWSMAARPLQLSIALMACGGIVLIAANWLKPVRPALAAALLIAFTVIDLRLQNGPNGATGLPPDMYEVLEGGRGSGSETIAALKRLVDQGRTDTRRDRVELIGLGFHWPNASLTHGLENTLGYNPVRLELYSKATGAGDSSGLPEQRKFTPLMPSYTSPLANLLGLRFIASGVPVDTIDPAHDAGGLQLIERTADAYIYENSKALPRVMFATRARQVDFDDLLRRGKIPNIDYRETVLLESVSGEAPLDADGSAVIASYRNDEIIIDTSSSHGGWLVLNDVWHPWWYAEVDGKELPILRANVLFRAVAVPRGRHTVRFTFRPLRGALEQLMGRH